MNSRLFFDFRTTILITGSLGGDALFKISGDVLTYTEDQISPRKIIIKNNKIVIAGTSGFSTECAIVKLDKDSLCFSGDFSDEIIRLIRWYQIVYSVSFNSHSPFWRAYILMLFLYPNMIAREI